MEKLKFKSVMFAMVLALLISCIPLNGFAEEDSLSKNIQKVKTLFKIGEEYEHFNKHQYDVFNGKNITNLSWSGQNRHISVDVDEEGNIIGYWKSEYSTDKNPRIYKFPKITKEQGEKAAKDFIKKLYPDILDKIKSRDEDELYSTYRKDNLREYGYSFMRIENDILFNENNVYIGVDNQTGEVTSFSINWENDLVFTDLKGIISKEEAKKVYKNNIDLELLYKIKETDKDIKPYLGYNILDTDKTVDAKTKDILSTSYKSMYSIYGPISYQSMENMSIEEESKLIDSKKIISRKEAGEKILDTFKLGEEYEVNSHKLKGNKEKDIYIWEVMVMKQVGNHGSGTSATINAKTGEIIDFSDPGSWGTDEEKAKYSKEELLEKAKEIIKNNSPEKYNEVEYIEDENEDLIYGENNISNFLFIRKVNGVKVENNGFRIALSNVTGSVLSYNYNWSDLEFESPNNLIEKDKAKEILLEDRELDLEYQIENKDKEKKNIKLVYDFRDKYLAVDAKEAGVIDNRKELGEKLAIKKYKDIENSFAKNQIQKLQNYIYLFQEDEFKPKQEITQKEFFQLLAQTKDIYYIYEDQNRIYERFIHEGILKEEEKNMEAKVN
ncbi:YcdB/YcdC domain-containing protein [Schnuerera ultunensis]|uniref:Putative Peptidase propeptide domain-containing protein n=1 Tax=[Clostridium] ultunense Esp TaxID=1288971 RepID=A0A1M4PR73_9FIRM|nr:YcdB/YcdC domain-containing protein [Schnuerera ultunensis]SHD78016.1 putative Peptidase propeptide domain-containing protein [[Clostridium] ultunense Esp]